jgi:hypothetical protein
MPKAKLLLAAAERAREQRNSLLPARKSLTAALQIAQYGEWSSLFLLSATLPRLLSIRDSASAALRMLS